MPPEGVRVPWVEAAPLQRVRVYAAAGQRCLRCLLPAAAGRPLLQAAVGARCPPPATALTDGPCPLCRAPDGGRWGGLGPGLLPEGPVVRPLRGVRRSLAHGSPRVVVLTGPVPRSPSPNTPLFPLTRPCLRPRRDRQKRLPVSTAAPPLPASHCARLWRRTSRVTRVGALSPRARRERSDPPSELHPQEPARRKAVRRKVEQIRRAAQRRLRTANSRSVFQLVAPGERAPPLAHLPERSAGGASRATASYRRRRRVIVQSETPAAKRRRSRSAPAANPGRDDGRRLHTGAPRLSVS